MAGQPLPYTAECFVCGRDNPLGLRLRFRWEDGAALCDFALPAHYNGYEGIAHGGIVCAVLDEAMCWAAIHELGRFCQTAEIAVRFRAAVAVQRHGPNAEPPQLRLRAWVTAQRARLAQTRGEIRDAEGRVLAESEGKFMAISADESARRAESLIVEAGAWTLP